LIELTEEIGKKANACDMERFIAMAINKCNENTDKKLGRYLGIKIAQDDEDEDNSMMIEAEINKRKYLEETGSETCNKENGGNQNKCLTSNGRSTTKSRLSATSK
jgi:hypothetical protein